MSKVLKVVYKEICTILPGHQHQLLHHFCSHALPRQCWVTAGPTRASRCKFCNQNLAPNMQIVNM